MQTVCRATPAGLGSSRSRHRAAGCEHGARLSGMRPSTDPHARRRSERPLRSMRTLFRELRSDAL